MRYTLAGFLFIILIAAVQPVSAQAGGELLAFQAEEWVEEVKCEFKTDRSQWNMEGLTFVDGRQVKLCLSVSAKKLQPASDGETNSSEMYITSYMMKGQPNLTNILLSRLDEGYPGLELKAAIPQGPEQSKGSASVRVFKVPVEVSNKARSAQYPITLTLLLAKAEPAKLDFTLPIFAPSDTSVLVKEKRQSLVHCSAGSNCSPLQLEIKNNLPYNVTIANVEILSELLDSQPANDYRSNIQAEERPFDLKLVMKAQPMTLSTLLSGFGLPQHSFRIDFEDQYGRSFSIERRANLEIKPSVLVIGLILVAGAAIGTYFRRDPGRLQNTTLNSTTKKWCFYGSTFLTGILLCAVAVFLDIKIIVLSRANELSAWDPKMLFVTVLGATLFGLPLLYAYFKMPMPKVEPAPPATGAGQSGNSNN